jgi:hypothetical protein
MQSGDLETGSGFRPSPGTSRPRRPQRINEHTFSSTGGDTVRENLVAKGPRIEWNQTLIGRKCLNIRSQVQGFSG